MLGRYVLPGRVWLVLTVALLLSACGAVQPEPPAASQSAASPTAPAPSATEAPDAVSTAQAPATSATPASSEGQSAGTRTTEHAMGTTTIEGQPERVVVPDTGELDNAMTLGVKPVGAVEAIPGEGFPAYLEGTEGIENVGTIEQPNLERIAALQPDLILSSKLRHEAIYDRLSEIAPTVFAETTGVTWKENFDLHAEALGKEDAAEAVKDQYQKSIEAFQDTLGDRLDETEISVVRFLPGDTRIYQKASFIGTVLEDVGLPRPPSQNVDDFAILNASAEVIPRMGGDVIFVTVYGPEQETTWEQITSNPLWAKLEAVQQGRVYEVPDDLWMLGIGYTAANGVIADLTQYLGEAGSAATSPAATETTGNASGAAPADGSAFPVAIEHKYGSTTVPSEPRRVVSAGYSDQDTLLALGVTPVAIRGWFGEQPHATWPWEADELGDATPEVLPAGDLNFEQIAALKPDLIVGISSGMTDEQYATLSKIAPTLAQPDEYVDFGTPWQEQTRLIGRAVGQSEQAEELIADVEEQFKAARDEHPEFAGATAAMAMSQEGTYFGYGPEDVRGRFLTSLGFELPGQLAELSGDQFYASISAERLDLLDADVLIWLVPSQAEREALEQNQVYQRLDAAREGRDLFLEFSDPIAGAISFSTVLSLPYLLDDLMPKLAAAVDGDPATESGSKPSRHRKALAATARPDGN